MRALKVKPGGIPQELKYHNQWVCWRAETTPDGKSTKVPYNARTGGKAISTEKNTWTSFDTAMKAYEADSYNGVGFVVSSEDPFIGIDLDGCIEDGELHTDVADIVDNISSYTEMSPSGTGIRIFAKAKLPPEGRKKGKYEIYDNARVLTVTGWHDCDSPVEIMERQTEVDNFHSKYIAKPKQEPINSTISSGNSLDDTELVQRACTARNGAEFGRLYAGDWSGYPSQSEADLAFMNMLAFWTGRDAARMENLFRSCGLYRDKCEKGRPTYLNRTISTAINGCSEVFNTMQETQQGIRHSGDIPQISDKSINQTDKTYNRTDVGNAERLVDRFGQNFRYSYQLKKWITWTGKRWEIDDSGTMYRYVCELARQMQRDVMEIEDMDKRKKAFEWAWSLEKAGNIENCLKCAQSLPGMAVKPTVFDNDLWIFNCQNGTLDLRTGELHPHRQEDYLMKISPISYVPNATAPTWERFLDRIMDGNKEKIAFLKRAAGYSLTGVTREQVLFFLYGVGGNGKTVFMSPLEKIMSDYHCSISTEVLMSRSDRDGGRGATPQLARLLNIRLTVASETDEGGRLSESLIKQMTGGDTLTARHLHAEPFDFIPVFKLWLYGNHKPTIRGSDEGIWRRVVLIPFEAVIPDEEKDLALTEKLMTELDGIFTWMVLGCFEWQKTGLCQPEEISAATKEYRSEMDSISNFIDECCYVAENVSVMSKDIYAAYSKWCDDNGENVKKQKMFGNTLKSKGFMNENKSGRGMRWNGIGLADIHRVNSLAIGGK